MGLKIFVFLSCLTITIISGVITFQQKQTYNRCLSDNNCIYYCDKGNCGYINNTVENCLEVVYNCENNSFSGYIYLFICLFGVFLTFISFMAALPGIEEMYLHFTTPMPKAIELQEIQLNN